MVLLTFSLRAQSSIMNDPRVLWIRNRVFNIYGINNEQVFYDLLLRDNGEAKNNLLKFLKNTPPDDKSCILFYKGIQEVEEEVEVEIGKIVLRFSQKLKIKNFSGICAE